MKKIQKIIYLIKNQENKTSSGLPSVQLAIMVDGTALIKILLFLNFSKYILDSNVGFISYLVNKYMSKNNKIKEWINKILIKDIDYNNRFIFIMFIINCIILIIISLINIYVSADLLVKIDDYLNVYNHINKSSILLFLGLSNKLLNYNRTNNNNFNNRYFSNNNKSTDLNKIYININKNIKQKSNYFNLYDKTKQNKELNLFKIISDNLGKSLNSLEQKNENLKSNSIFKYNKLKTFVNASKNFNKNIVSYIKSKDLKSILFFWKNSQNLILEKKKENKKEQIQSNLKTVKEIQKKSDMNINENNNKIKIIIPFKGLKLKKKNKKISNSQIIKSINLSIERNLNIIKNIDKRILKLKEENKSNSSIFIFVKNFKQKQNKNFENLKKSLIKYKILNFQKMKYIRKYINSKTTFNSKFAKILVTGNNYKFNKYNQINNLIKINIYEFLHRSFISMSSLISKPVFVITPDKIIIQLFYLLLKKKYIKNYNNNKSMFIIENSNKLKIICNVLTRFFKKPIELELIRLYYPYYNSNILVNLFGIYINKIKLRRIVKNFIGKAIKTKFNFIKKISLPSDLTGIKIKVAGRLLTQRVVPRKTVKFIKRGALARCNAMFVETARYTNKNKRGAFSITVSIGHKFN